MSRYCFALGWGVAALRDESAETIDGACNRAHELYVATSIPVLVIDTMFGGRGVRGLFDSRGWRWMSRCTRCLGSGAIDAKSCVRCDGHGVVEDVVF